MKLRILRAAGNHIEKLNADAEIALLPLHWNALRHKG